MRECGGCTVCCDLFPVPQLDKEANQKCIHCQGGCLIHETRPQACRDFNCAYIQSNSPEDLRPDRCGVVFEKVSDRIFYGTAWKKMTERAQGQVRAFLGQGFSVVLATNVGGVPRFYISPEHDEAEIRSEFVEHLEARYGHVRN